MARKPAKRKAPARKTARGAAKKTAKKAAKKPVSKGAKKTARKAARKTAPKKAARPKAKPRAAAKAKPSSRPKVSVAAKTSAAKKPAAVKPARHAPSLDRNRRRLPEVEDNIPTPPSSLDLDRTPTAARSGRQAQIMARSHHNETSPELTGGDVDADWEDAYAVGDEAPGGDNPTPDQDRVDDIGRALGVEYQDNEELKGADKIAGRDKHRWELDPASAEDYNDRDED